MSTEQNADAQRDAMRAARNRIDHVNGWLRLGGAIPASEAERLQEAGVTRIVDLREADEFEAAQVDYPSIERRHVPVPNHGAPTLAQLQDVTEWLAQQGDENSVYVHCAGGFGRAATMAIGLLVQRGASVDEAEATVRAARPEIRINDDQRDWLRDVESLRSTD